MQQGRTSISRKNKDKDLDSRIDWGIIFCVLMLALIGIASTSTSAAEMSASYHSSTPCPRTGFGSCAVVVFWVSISDAPHLPVLHYYPDDSAKMQRLQCISANF